MQNQFFPNFSNQLSGFNSNKDANYLILAHHLGFMLSLQKSWELCYDKGTFYWSQTRAPNQYKEVILPV